MPKTPDNAPSEKLKISEANGSGVFWPEGLTPMPHQLEAVNFALARKKSYLALDPGLGKTIVAALIANKTQGHIFYICPPFLVQNTDAEFDKWCFEKRLTLLPDSMLNRAKTRERIKFQLSLIPKDVERILIVDEAHRIKNPSTDRGAAVYSMLHFFDRIIFMSGTPMPNARPIELYPACKVLGPEMFPENRFQFGIKFCAAYKSNWGWKFDGVSNQAEFRMRLFRSFMLRQKKTLLNLPAKTEGLLTVGEGIPAIVSKLEKKILDHYGKEDLAFDEIAEGQPMHLATYLKELGQFKLKWALPVIEQILAETKENILVFAIHKGTVAGLKTALAKYNPLVITGDVGKEKRQSLVNEFQNNPERRLFIGNIQACGVGFTLTKATRVIFVEFSWVDGENLQASDRAHRIGQDKNILVQYVVLKDSLDGARMKVVLKKRQHAI